MKSYKKTRLTNLHDKVLSDCDVIDPVVLVVSTPGLYTGNILYMSFSMGAGKQVQIFTITITTNMCLLSTITFVSATQMRNTLDVPVDLSQTVESWRSESHGPKFCCIRFLHTTSNFVAYIFFAPA